VYEPASANKAIVITLQNTTTAKPRVVPPLALARITPRTPTASAMIVNTSPTVKAPCEARIAAMKLTLSAAIAKNKAMPIVVLAFGFSATAW